MVNRVRADERQLDDPISRVNEHGVALPATEATVAADQLLEGSNVPAVERAVDDKVANVGQCGVAQNLARCIRAERRQRIGADDPVVLQIVHAVAAKDDHAVLSRSGNDETDCLVRSQVDEPQVAGCRDDNTAAVVSTRLSGIVMARALTLRKRTAEPGDRAVSPSDGRKQRGHRPPLLRRSVVRDDCWCAFHTQLVAALGGQRCDNVGKRLTASLAKGLALALTVIGEHNEDVRPWRCRGDALQRLKCSVDAGNRRERLSTHRPSVVGDFVIVGEVAVHDRRAGEHLFGKQPHVDVA